MRSQVRQGQAGIRFVVSPGLSLRQTLNTRSLHSTAHRFAMICSGRDDRIGGSHCLCGVTSMRYGYRAQVEMTFGYLSEWGHGCYTRELWQS